MSPFSKHLLQVGHRLATEHIKSLEKHEVYTWNLHLPADKELEIGIFFLTRVWCGLSLHKTRWAISGQDLCVCVFVWGLYWFNHHGEGFFNSSRDMNWAHIPLLTASWSPHIYVCVVDVMMQWKNECACLLNVTQYLGIDVTEWFNFTPNDWTVTLLSHLYLGCVLKRNETLFLFLQVSHDFLPA